MMNEPWSIDLNFNHYLMNALDSSMENAEVLLTKQIRIAVSNKKLQEKTASLKKLKSYWDLLNPTFFAQRTSCAERGHLTLLFNESLAHTAHMKLIFQYALALQNLDCFERICLVGTQEFLAVEPSLNFNRRLYGSYVEALQDMADLGGIAVSNKIQFLHFQPFTIPECILWGPIIRFRGLAEWNDPVRYMSFLSKNTTIISATYSTRVKRDSREHLLLVRNRGEAIGENVVFYDPPLIISPPSTSISVSNFPTLYTILSGSRIESILRSFTRQDWDVFRSFLAANNGYTWRFIGSPDLDKCSELIPPDLIRYFQVDPFTELNSINFSKSILFFPKGAFGGGRTAMEALARGASIFGISNRSEIEECIGSEFFFQDYASAFDAISNHFGSIKSSSNTWIKQWDNVKEKTQLEMKALELRELLFEVVRPSD